MTKILKTLNMSRIVMTDLEFLDTAERLLSRIETSCDRINDETDADIDNQRVGGMITITFGNRSQIIVNLQKPLHEVWLAAKSGGHHYKFKDGTWRTPKVRESFLKTSHALGQRSRANR